MDCTQTLQLIYAYADGELDADRRAEAELHLRTCASCAAALENLSALKASMAQAALLHRAPETLRGSIEQMLQRAAADEPQDSRRSWRWLAVAAILLIGVGAYLLFAGSKNSRLAKMAAIDHHRCLAGNHLLDIASSDPAKVAGWLGAKLAFAPWVPKQPPAGYVLLGGRIDLLDGLKVVALEYQSGEQIVSLFEWPSAQGASAMTLNYQFGGFAEGLWNAPGAWNFCAVASHVNAIDSMRNVFSIKACSTNQQ